ncbi:hypothetical protein E6W17_10525 [Streptomyces sp. A1547]|nr:hypothetical protein E6W17_10525 [Streptomyces sp. A1547]
MRTTWTARDLAKRHESGSQPRCPSCICSGLEPHCRTSRRAPAADAFTEVLLIHFTAGYCQLHHCVNCGTAHGGP